MKPKALSIISALALIGLLAAACVPTPAPPPSPVVIKEQVVVTPTPAPAGPVGKGAALITLSGYWLWTIG